MFTKKPTAKPENRAVAANRNASSSTFSVLGADTRINGDIEASSDLHIDGSVEGDISCSALVQGDSGLITGAVRAQTARIAGTILGSIDASELVVLKTARITGDVSYDALTIEQGAQVDGKLTPRGASQAASGPAASSVKSGEDVLILEKTVS